MNMKSSSGTKEKMKKKMMMRGFMCQSQAATAVCMTSADVRSVIVPPPTRPAAATGVHHHNRNAGHYMMMRRSTSTTNAGGGGGHYYYYSRLLDTTPPAYDHETSHSHNRRRSTSTSSLLNHHDHQPMSKSIRKKPLSEPADSLLPSSADNNVFQVVVMRVSIHCQGCAGKVKKHLSKMEGVTSFSIDLETKMVTVRGHVSPVGVVESISKVKKAELLTS